MDNTTTVELPSSLVEEAEERHEEYGFPTPEGMIAYALRNYLSEDPELTDEHREDLLESRKELRDGEKYSGEGIIEELRGD